MAEIDARLRGEPRVSDAMRACEFGDVIRGFQIFGRPHLLDDFQMAAEADNLGSRLDRLNGLDQTADAGFATDSETQVAIRDAGIADSRELAHGCQNLGGGSVKVMAPGQSHLRDGVVAFPAAVKRHSRRIRAAASERAEHAEHGLPERTGSTTRFVQKTNDSAHPQPGFLQYTGCILKRASWLAKIMPATLVRRR